jgi:hypothetical protein
LERGVRARWNRILRRTYSGGDDSTKRSASTRSANQPEGRTVGLSIRRRRRKTGLEQRLQVHLGNAVALAGRELCPAHPRPDIFVYRPLQLGANLLDTLSVDEKCEQRLVEQQPAELERGQTGLYALGTGMREDSDGMIDRGSR